jgi:hypothetical protein
MLEEKDIFQSKCLVMELRNVHNSETKLLASIIQTEIVGP